MFVTARIQAAEAKKSWVGTGFVYGVETEKGTAHVLVTNKHVLEGAEKLTVSFVRADASNNPVFGDYSAVNIEPFDDSSWHGHPNGRS